MCLAVIATKFGSKFSLECQDADTASLLSRYQEKLAQPNGFPWSFHGMALTYVLIQLNPDSQNIIFLIFSKPFWGILHYCENPPHVLITCRLFWVSLNLSQEKGPVSPPVGLLFVLRVPWSTPSRIWMTCASGWMTWTRRPGGQFWNVGSPCFFCWWSVFFS